MRDLRPEDLSRRRFIANAACVASVLPLSAVSLASSTGGDSAALSAASLASVPAVPNVASRANVTDTANGPTARASGYRALSAQEARIVETLVNALCPADALTDDGLSSGLATFIDAYLAGEIAVSAPGAPQLLRSGFAPLDDFSRAHDGVAFAHRSSGDAGRLLARMRTGAGDDRFPLSNWNAEVLEPVLKQACFAAPVYDRYGSRMFVKLFG